MENSQMSLPTNESEINSDERAFLPLPSVETNEKKSDDEDNILDILGNGQLTKKNIRKAHTAIQPQQGDLVTISFTGKISNGVEVESETEMTIHVGDMEVIQGLDMAIPLMRVGELAEVAVDSRFAYGVMGYKNENDPYKNIPPNSNIVYQIELINCKSEDFDDIKTYDIRTKYGNSKKDRGNFWYGRSEFNIAIQLYRRALEYLDFKDGDPNFEEDLEITDQELQNILENRLVVYNNLAMAQIKVNAYDAALSSVEHVIRCQPNNSKALYRKARILEAKGDLIGAIDSLQKAGTYESESRTIKQELGKLIIRKRREEHNEKEMYKKMLGHANKLELKIQKHISNPQKDVPKLKLLGYILGSILIGVAGVAIYRYKY